MSERLPFPPLMVAVAGCSGSGKTTLAAELARTLGGLHFHLDNYYRDLSHLPPEERAHKDFDDPSILEIELLAEHVAALARGESIKQPVYDFATHTRRCDRCNELTPGPVVLVEGILALHYKELLPHYHLGVYVDTPDAMCLERRINRDIVERGRTRESVLEQYEATVRPASLRYVRPSSHAADIVLDGHDELDWKVEVVYKALRERGLWRFSA